MKLIFIRHGDPDYKNNTVTAKGAREADLLARRIAGWDVTDFYCSPYGRAVDTLKPALLRTGRTAETLDWLHEFDYHVTEPGGKERSVCWDVVPRDFFDQPKYLSRAKWQSIPYLKKAGIGGHYDDACRQFDALLEQYDYTRLGPKSAIYNCLPHLTQQEAAVDTHLNAQQPDRDPRTLVFVCHLGIMFALISHLTMVSPYALWQGFFVAPTSVTVLGTEERVPGQAIFRVQAMGDVQHLTQAGEPPSASGFFGNVSAF